MITLILVIGIILARTETDQNSKILISLLLIKGYRDISVLGCVVFSDCRKMLLLLALAGEKDDEERILVVKEQH